MCEPATLAIVGTAVATAGTVVAGVNQSNMQRYQAKIAERNAAIERNAAQDALERGRIEEQRQYRKNAQRLGAQRAAMAANGIEVDFGSALDLQTDTKQVGWEDAQTIRENSMREAKGYEIRAWNSEAEASAKRSAASATLFQTAFDAGSTMLSGAQQYRKLQAPTKVPAAQGA